MIVVFTRIHHLYTSAYVRTIRFFIILLLIYLVAYQLYNNISPRSALLFFNTLLMIEIFFRYKVSRAAPSLKLSRNKGKNIYESFTMASLYGFISESGTEGIIKKIITYPQVKAVMQKANIASNEIIYPNISKKVLAESAFEAAKTFKGDFVTTLDVFAAYLMLTEKESKLFFAKQLKSADLYNIIFWAKIQFPDEESPKKLRVRFEGSGFGEALVSGWTYETRKYSANFTSEALRAEPSIRGREPEFKRLLEALVKIEDNNVLLVGDIGSGKENLVRALAYHSYEGNLGSYLNHRRVFQLMIGPLTAGVRNRGELEERLEAVIAEISHAQDIILYIPEFQNILGASSYNLDLSAAFLPYLKSGAMPIVATMTSGEFKTFMEKNPLKEAFVVVDLKEPEQSSASQMVMENSLQIEKKYKVFLSYRAIDGAVRMAGRFYQDQALPGSAVSLLETVANAVNLSKERPYYDRTHRKMVLEEDVVKKVEETTHIAIAMPTGKEIDLLLHLEDKLHERLIAQEEAVTAISEAMRRVRTGVMTSERPISFLFLGPTGVGKTETAKALADLYYGGQKKMIRLDMSEFTDESGVRRLLGAPPGAGNERGELTDKIHDNPSSLVLLDEFEKANKKIHDLFLQVFDDGRLTDNKGVTVSFRNAIVIATSNAGSEFIREEVEKGTPVDKNFQKRLLDHLQSQGIFKPELLNRFDEVITFKPLGNSQVGEVVKLMLKELTKNLSEQDISLIFDDAVIEKIANEGFDKEFGARPLRRFIQDNIEDIIAQKKLTHEVDRGKTVHFSVGGMANIQAEVS